MPKYHEFMMRHGEHGVEGIVKEAERANGIKHPQLPSLEERWEVVFGEGGDLNGAPAMSMAA